MSVCWLIPIGEVSDLGEAKRDHSSTPSVVRSLTFVWQVVFSR